MGITNIATAFPKQKLPIERLVEDESLDSSDALNARQLGIDEVRTERKKSSIELMIVAARKLLGDTNVEASDIDWILVCEPRAPEAFMSSEAQRLQYEIGALNATAFSIGDLGCVSSSTALQLAAQICTSANVLIVTGSRPFGKYRYRSKVTVIGDGACAVLLQSDRGFKVLASETKTNGKYWDLYTVNFKDIPQDEWRERNSSDLKYSFELATESRAVFGKMIEGLRQRFSHTEPLFHHAIMQNISRGAFSFYESSLGIAFSDVCTRNLSRYGHLGSADIFVNLNEGYISGEFKQGERVLILNNSPVAAWGVSLIEI